MKRSVQQRLLRQRHWQLLKHLEMHLWEPILDFLTFLLMEVLKNMNSRQTLWAREVIHEFPKRNVRRFLRTAMLAEGLKALDYKVCYCRAYDLSSLVVGYVFDSQGLGPLFFPYANSHLLGFSGFTYQSSGMSTPDMGLQSPIVTGKRSLPGELGSNSVPGSIPVKRARSSATNLRPRASHSCISPGIIVSHHGCWMLASVKKGTFPLLATNLACRPLS